MWKLIYGLTTIKEGEEDPFEGRNDDGEEEENDKEKEEIKNKEDVEKETQEGDKATTKEQQQEQSVQDTQLPPPSPPHIKTTPVDSIAIKDVLDTSGQKINPLIVEDLKKILHQTTLQSQLCTNPILVSVEELQRQQLR